MGGRSGAWEPGFAVRLIAKFKEGQAVSDAQAELDRHFAWIAGKMPPRGAACIHWLREPSSRLVRIPLSGLLILGGIFSFLPILGIWMLPLGLLLIAQDVPFLQEPLARALGWIERKWMGRKI